MKVTYLGHAGFLLVSESASLLIDPWFTENPRAAPLPQDARPDLIALTHGHFDHLGDSLKLADEFDIPILALPELATYCAGKGARTELINFGGSFFNEDLEIKCVLAFHSSSGGKDRANAPGACGYVVRDGQTALYHAGDTCVFGDMRLIGDRFDLDVSILPIGGRSTMDPDEAILAVQFLRPRLVIPMHFGTWDFINQDVSDFKNRVEENTDSNVVILEPGGATNIARRSQ